MSLPVERLRVGVTQWDDLRVTLVLVDAAVEAVKVELPVEDSWWGSHVLLATAGRPEREQKASRFPRVVEGRKAFWCRSCARPMLFFDEEARRKHAYNVHGPGAQTWQARRVHGIRSYWCRRCKIPFGSRRARRDHWLTYHQQRAKKGAAAGHGDESEDELTLRSFTASERDA